MKTLYIMIGIPGAGKSTYAHENFPEAMIVCPDTIRKELYGDERIQGDGRKVFRIAHDEAEHYLLGGFDVVIDATNLTPKARKFWNNLPYIKRVAVIVDTPLQTSIRRNYQRDRRVPTHIIIDKYNKMVMPTAEEYFDEIISV